MAYGCSLHHYCSIAWVALVSNATCRIEVALWTANQPTNASTLGPKKKMRRKKKKKAAE